MLSAKWDHGKWGQSYWDRLVAELTGAWTSGNDSWTSTVNIGTWANGLWTEAPDTWTSMVNMGTWANVYWEEAQDAWAIDIAITEDSQSTVIENPDFWSALMYVTLHPPSYNAGGGWGWSKFGEQPKWGQQKDKILKAVKEWRYGIQARVEAKDDSWSGSATTVAVEPDILQAQIVRMFGPQKYVIDWVDEAVIEELLLL